MAQKFRIAGLVFFVALLVAAGIAAKVFIPVKGFEVPRVAVDATLEPNGTLAIVEHITYDFTGSFTFGTRPIPVGTYTISDVVVREDGVELQSVGAPYNLQWFFAATDETRTFDISCRVTGATAAGSDVAEVYWKWVGDDHPDIGRVTTKLHLPEGKGPEGTGPEGTGTVRAWGHGPLNGVVRPHENFVSWRATDVPRGTFFEGRVALPVARVPGVVPDGIPRLVRLQAEEQAGADAANRLRDQARADEQRNRAIRVFLSFAAPFLALLGAAGFWILFKKYGKEPPLTTPVGEYFRDLPDDPPAVVAALMHWGAVQPAAFSATVLDLAQRGYLTVTERVTERALLPDTTDFELIRTEQSDRDLLDFERLTLDQIFASGSPVLQSEIAKYSRGHQTEALKRWNGFKNNVSTSLRMRGYINGGRSVPFVANVGAAVVTGVVGAAALAYRAWIPGGLALGTGALMVCLTPLLRQRTPKGAQRFHEWIGVRNYLRDYSQLEDAPAGHLILWERYLVYAAALGVSKELAAGLATRIPPEQQTAFAPWYVGMHAGSSIGSIGNFTSGIANTTSSFTPQSSSSSGSGAGGGFSGGGGGGGGGGIGAG